MTLIEQVQELLKGIDQTECDFSDGWWETSDGAKFGAEKLKALIDLIKGVTP
jgi:hypothetical protein